MRKILAALLTLCLIGPIPGMERARVAEQGGQAIMARPVAIPAALAGTGPLRLTEAWALTSPNSRFGGLSGLALTGERRFLIVSDQGMMARLRLPVGGGAATDSRIDPITGIKQHRHKAFSDAEAVIYDAKSGKSWISFEGIAQIWRTNERTGEVEARHRPASLFRWPANRGPEAMVRLDRRRFLVFSEDADHPRGTEAMFFPTDPAEIGPAPVRFFYDAEGKGQLTEAAMLPDGRLLLLHRRVQWTGFWRGRQAYVSTIAVADPAGIKRDSVLRSATIAVIGPRALSDNFEGMALGTEGGAPVLWLVSDDNFNGWQDNLLLKFSVDLAALPKAPPVAR
jgi:hypothetical protein